MNNIETAFLLTFIAGLSTMIGSVFIFFKDKRGVILKNSLSFASGVMVCVSAIDLIPESITLLYNGDKTCTFIMVLFFILIGILISFVIDKCVPEFEEKRGGSLLKIGIFSMLAIILHNIPEGIATFLSSATNMKLGIALTMAIALHNIPEGISISVPVYKASKSRKKALFYTFISGMSEPFGALLAFFFLAPIINNTIMGVLLSLIAGIMIHIASLKLLPTALKYKNKKRTMMFFIVGMLFMYFSHLLMINYF